MKNFLKINIPWILILLLSVPAVVALFHKGYFGASDDLHIAWLYEMDRLIKIGQIPPRFVPDLSFGFGYPLFNFVFPLPFYLAEIFHLVGFSLVDSVKIVFGVSLVLSAPSMYLFLKELLSKEMAIVGSLIYLYTPYRSTDVYIRGAIGESLAFVFLPLILYSIIRIYKSNAKKVILWKYISVFSLSLGGLILTHNIVSYMFSPFILMLILILVFSVRDKLNFVINNISGLIGGLLISIYFWLPAIIESGLMKYETVFNFADHFPTLKQLVTPYFGYGASVPGPYDGMSFFIGLVNLIVILLGLILGVVYIKRLKTIEKSVFIWGVLVLGLSVFMMNFRSSFFWSNLPLLPYFQFPWRFLTMTTFVSVIFLVPLSSLGGNYKRAVAILLAVGVVLINFGYFKPNDFLQRTDAYYLNRYIPVPVASPEYLETGEEYLRLPVAADIRPDKNYPPVFSDKKFEFNVVWTDGLNSDINVSLGEEGRIYYNKYFFPGWTVFVNGQNVSVEAGKPFGQIAVDVPGGNSFLEFRFKETPFKMFLNIVSGIALLVSVFVLIKKR